MSAAQDTWAQLPLVTLPLPSLRADTSGQLVSISTAELRAAQHPDAQDWRASEAARWASWGAARGGARITLTYRQIVALLLVAGALALLLYVNPYLVLIVPNALIVGIYLTCGLHKGWLLAGSEAAGKAAGDEDAALPDEDLPTYTVLVPLRREAVMLPVLIERLLALDYPLDRLEVLLLVESDDDETHAALGECYLPPHIRPVTAPPGWPRTKPRALNVGLARARSEYIVVYDAEDRPEPDQLRKAVAAFRRLPRRVVCLQARLGFYNPRQSMLTRLFTVDYTLWYNALLPRLVRAGTFVPLGGTSNHFRVEPLRRLGGWDPFNVTEDCDLGARVARAGLRVALLDSTTDEEAVPWLGQWIRQRSRWVKGYMQTYLVHMRDPLRLWREMGPRGFCHFQLLVGGTSLVLLINPLMWGMTLAYTLGGGTPVAPLIRLLFPTPVYYVALLSLVAGNFAFFYINLYVCVRYGHQALTRYALLSPLYWVLMSLGAWVGLLSLARRPHYWAKTAHGASLAALEAIGPVPA